MPNNTCGIIQKQEKLERGLGLLKGVVVERGKELFCYRIEVRGGEGERGRRSSRGFGLFCEGGGECLRVFHA